MSGKEGGDVVHLGGTAIKPIERKGWEAVRYVLYNPETGAILSRTPKSWFLIIAFYVVYYICLAAFWYGLLMAFFTTISNDRPKWTLDSSLIGNSPGLGLRPSQPDATIDSAMIFLKKDDKDGVPSEDLQTPSNADWAARYEKYLTNYDNDTGVVSCEDGIPSKDAHKACKFNKVDLGECAEYPFGYQVEAEGQRVSPCLLIKPNRIYNWAPTPYEESEVDELDAPLRVKQLLKANPNKIYVDCDGENPYDREGLAGKLSYFPEDQGIDFKYFPYIQVNNNYHNPAVAVKVSGIEAGRLYHVSCLLWGKGIVHHKKDRMGLVRFEMLIE